MNPRNAFALIGAIALVGCSSPHVEVSPERPSEAAASVSAAPHAEPNAVRSVVPPKPTASAAPVSPDARIVTFSLHAANVGDRFHEHTKLHSELDGSVVFKTVHMGSDDEMERDVTVVAVSEGVVSKVKLSYGKVARTRTFDGKSKPNPGPVEGRSYFVERKATKLAIDAVDGAPLTEPERTEIAMGMTSFGKPDLVAKSLASKPRRIGERLDDVATAMKERYDADKSEGQKPGDHSELTELVVTFARVERFDDGEVALLDVSSTMSGVRDGADGTQKTKGTNAFRIDGAHLVRTHVEGASTMKKGLLSGNGTMTIDFDGALVPLKPGGANKH